MSASITYHFTAAVWLYEGVGGWYFVSLPEEMSTEIRALLQTHEEGWGRLKAIAKIGKSEWKTSIWYATKRNTYILPIKSAIRKKEKIEAGDTITVTVLL